MNVKGQVSCRTIYRHVIAELVIDWFNDSMINFDQRVSRHDSARLLAW